MGQNKEQLCSTPGSEFRLLFGAANTRKASFKIPKAKDGLVVGNYTGDSHG